MDARFAGEAASAYARQARRLIPDYEGLHHGVARTVAGVRSLLSVGCGDGEELARSSAEIRVGIDPSPSMAALAEARLGSRAQIVVGEPNDVEGTFEAVTSILVGHFVPYEERDGFYAALRARCEGILVVAEAIAPIDADLWTEWMIDNGTPGEKARSAVEAVIPEIYPLSREELIAKIERTGFQFGAEIWSGAPFAAISFRAS